MVARSYLFKISAVMVVAMLAAFAAFAAAAWAATGTFTNPALIQIPATGTSGQANPYPSENNVSGFHGSVSDVNLKLNSFNQTFPDDVDVLLVGPSGQNAIAMSDVGGAIGAVNLNLTLDDEAASALPDAGPLVGGTFRPTNIGAGDAFPAPAPTPTGGAALSIFDGTNPNGAWKLYVFDDSGGDIGSFAGGWSLEITTAPTPPCTIDGTDGNNVLDGTTGNDVICGFGGNDTINGRGGNDDIFGGAGRDTLKGGPGRDDVFGQGGRDSLNTRDGVRGNDFANGGAQRDRCVTDRNDRKVSCP